MIYQVVVSMQRFFFTCTGPVDLEDGLYTVEDSKLVGYSDWAM